MLLGLLITIILLWAAARWLKNRRMYQIASRLPGSIRELPLLGIAHTLVGDSEDIMEQAKSYSYEAMRSDGILRIWCFHLLFCVLINPVDLEFVLRTCLDKSHLHRFTNKVIGNGVIFAPVPIWRRRRKIIVPTFSPKIVDTFVEVFARHSEKMVNILERHANGGPFSMWPFLSSFTLESVCETTMGVKINAQENPDTPLLVAMSAVLHLVCQRYFRVWLQPDWIYQFHPQNRQLEYHLHIMHSFTDKVIKNTRKHIDSTKRFEADSRGEITSLDNCKLKTFLDHLIDLSEGKSEIGLTDLELREEIMTLAIGGTDTSAVTVGFTLTLLAKYPHIQEEVYKELYEVFGESDRPLVKADLANLKLMDRVVKETLRLFPPVPIILRKVDEDITLPSGRQLPKGMILIISIWGIHRDPKYWGPDAEKFDPNRFLPERFKLAHVCSYMPFSQGPRNCVGYQYAMMSIKTALSAILRRFKIMGEIETSPVPKIRVKLALTLNAVDEYTVALERRKHFKDIKKAI